MVTPHGAQAGQPVCARHRDRPTGLSCARCGRPACPECLVDASVGFHCVDCVNEGRKTTRRATTVAGAETGGKPVLVPALIGINVAVFVLTVAIAQSLTANDDSALFRALSAFTPSITDGQLWRLFTSGFLHFGPFHLLVNMIALWFLRDVETVLGRARFAAVYVLATFGGSIAEYVFGDVGGQGAGASGAVYGLLGAFVVIMIRLKRARSPVQLILMVLALTLVTSLVFTNVSLLAHLGGLVVGAAITVGFAYAPPAQRVRVHIGIVVLVAVVLLGLFVLRYSQLADVLYCMDATALACYIRG